MVDLFYTITLKIYRRIEKKINSKSHAREVLRLVANVPVDISTLNLHWLQIRINTRIRNKTN